MLGNIAITVLLAASCEADRFGEACLVGSDCNGDGISDLYVVDPEGGWKEPVESGGYLWLLSGKDGSRLNVVEIPGMVGRPKAVIGGLPDLTNGGIREVLVFNSQHSVFLVDGSSLRVLGSKGVGEFPIPVQMLCAQGKEDGQMRLLVSRASDLRPFSLYDMRFSPESGFEMSTVEGAAIPRRVDGTGGGGVLPDVNGDGWDDFAVGFRGGVSILSGINGKVICQYEHEEFVFARGSRVGVAIRQGRSIVLAAFNPLDEAAADLLMGLQVRHGSDEGVQSHLLEPVFRVESPIEGPDGFGRFGDQVLGLDRFGHFAVVCNEHCVLVYDFQGNFLRKLYETDFFASDLAVSGGSEGALAIGVSKASGRPQLGLVRLYQAWRDKEPITIRRADVGPAKGM